MIRKNDVYYHIKKYNDYNLQLRLNDLLLNWINVNSRWFYFSITFKKVIGRGGVEGDKRNYQVY